MKIYIVVLVLLVTESAMSMGIFTTRGREKRERQKVDRVQAVETQNSAKPRGRGAELISNIKEVKTANNNGCDAKYKEWQPAEKKNWYFRCVRSCDGFSYFVRVEQSKEGRIEDFSVDRVEKGEDPKKHISLVKDIFDTSRDASKEPRRVVNCSRSEKTESATVKLEAMASQLIKGLQCPDDSKARLADGSRSEGFVELTEEAQGLSNSNKGINQCLSRFAGSIYELRKEPNGQQNLDNYQRQLSSKNGKSLFEQKLDFSLNGGRLAFRRTLIGSPARDGQKKAALEVACNYNSCGGADLIRSVILNNLADVSSPFNRDAGPSDSSTSGGNDEARVE